MKFFLVFMISILLLQAFAAASSFNNPMNSASVDEESEVVALNSKKHHPQKINCSYACKRRCRKASRKNMCHRACKTCCTRCHCVPPGTYGNTHVCPCYASLRTHGNRLKCP